VRVSFIALENMPAGATQGLGSLARLIAVERSGAPVLATPRLTQATRLAETDDAEQFGKQLLAAGPRRAVAMGIIDGALPVGVTATFEAAQRHPQPWIVAGQIVRRSVKIDLYRAAGPNPAQTPLRVALVIEDLVTPPNPAEQSNEPSGPSDKHPATAPAQAPGPPPEPVLQREMAIFDRTTPAEHDSFALLVPFRFGDSSSRVVAIVVRVMPGNDDPEHVIATARCQEQVAAAAKWATTRPYQALIDDPDWPSFATALDTLGHSGSKREALVFLASQTGADICEDAALVADAPTLEALARQIEQQLGPSPSITSKESLGWVLERSSLQLMAQQLSGGKLASELAATLTLHAGEAGRHPGALSDILQAVHNRPEFDLRLAAENYIFLEDSSPASRVRAFDWLRARDRAPVGFNPLGSPHERGAALERALNAATSPADVGGAP
jgi:hypothetical protein